MLGLLKKRCLTIIVRGVALSLTFSVVYLNVAVASPSLSDPELDAIFSMSLQELQDVIIISASKREQNISQVAAAAFVINADEINRFGYRTIGEALQRISGMYLSSDRNYDYLGVRGFSLPGDYNTRILLLVDGHRTNGDVYDQAYMDHSFPIDIKSVEQIEVVKGPGSALWGSNALFAVINVITKKADTIQDGLLLLEAGDHDHFKGFLEYGETFENGLEISGSFTSLDSSGEPQVFFPERRRPEFNDGIAGNADGENAYKGNFFLSYNDWSLLFYKSKRSKDVPTGAWDGAFVIDDAINTIDENMALELLYENNLSALGAGHFVGRIYYDEFDYAGNYLYYDEGAWLGTLITNMDVGSSKQWGAEFRYSTDFLRKGTMTIGVEYLDVFEITQKNWDIEPYWLGLDTGKDDNSYHSTAYYLQAEYDVLETMQVIGGLRLDRYSTFGEQVSPRFALLYPAWRSTTMKALYGEAFRAPNDFERNYDDNYAMLANPDLQPEEVHTWELVVEHDFRNNLRLVASVYRFKAIKLISQIVTDDDMLQFQNTSGTVRSDGVEIQLAYNFSNSTSGYVTMATSNTKNLESDTRLNNSPQLLMAGGVSVPLWSERIHVSPEVRFVDERLTSTNMNAESFVQMDLTISAENILKNIEMSLHVANLFDEDIFFPGAGEHYFYDPDQDDYVMFNIPQTGRVLRFQLSYKY